MSQAVSWHPDRIEWQEIGSDGTKYALLEGRRDRAGEAFTYAFFIPAGFWDPAHWHTQDARVVVLQGTLYSGYGDEHNEQDLQAYPLAAMYWFPQASATLTARTKIP